MGSPYDIIGTGGPRRSQLVEASISSAQPAPTSFDDPLFVSVPWLLNGEFWTITDWGAIHGATLPTQGAACLVAVSDQGVRRVIWWDGVYTMPG